MGGGDQGDLVRGEPEAVGDGGEHAPETAVDVDGVGGRTAGVALLCAAEPVIGLGDHADFLIMRGWERGGQAGSPSVGVVRYGPIIRYRPKHTRNQGRSWFPCDPFEAL